MAMPTDACVCVCVCVRDDGQTLYVLLLPFAIASFALMFGNWSQVREMVANLTTRHRATPSTL